MGRMVLVLQYSAIRAENFTEKITPAASWRQISFAPLVYHAPFMLTTAINGQLQVDLNKGVCSLLQTLDERNLAAANSGVFLDAYHLVQTRVFPRLNQVYSRTSPS